jgi:hypothetical protein
MNSRQFINKLLYKELRNKTTRNEPVTNNAAGDGVCEDSAGIIAWSQVASTYKRSSKNLRSTDILQPSKSLPTTNRFSALTQLPEPLISSETNFVAGRRTMGTSNSKHKRKEDQRSTRHTPNNHYVRNYGQPSKVYRAPESEPVGDNNNDPKHNLNVVKDRAIYYRNDKDNSGKNDKVRHKDHKLIPTLVNVEIKETANSEITSKRKQNGKCLAWINEIKAKLIEKRNSHTLN